MRARAVSVKRSAATVSFGTSRTLRSSVTVPITTAVLSLEGNFSWLDDLLLIAEVFDHFWDRNWRSRGSGRNETSQNGLSKSRVGPSGQESEQLHTIHISKHAKSEYLPWPGGGGTSSCSLCFACFYSWIFRVQLSQYPTDLLAQDHLRFLPAVRAPTILPYAYIYIK